MQALSLQLKVRRLIYGLDFPREHLVLCAFQELNDVRHVNFPQLSLRYVIVTAASLLQLYEIAAANDESYEGVEDLARLVDNLDVRDGHSKWSYQLVVLLLFFVEFLAWQRQRRIYQQHEKIKRKVMRKLLTQVRDTVVFALRRLAEILNFVVYGRLLVRIQSSLLFCCIKTMSDHANKNSQKSFQCYPDLEQ